MSSAIAKEAGFWLYAVALGIQLLLLYDLLRIFRRLLSHGNMAIGLEDFCYWMAAGVMIFHMLYKFNYGIIRWFAVFGMLVGMVLYHLTVSKPVVNYGTKWLRAFFGLVGRPLGILWRKARIILTFAGKIRKKVTFFLKKKLKIRKKECNMRDRKNGRSVPIGKEKSRKAKAETTEQTNAH